MTIWIPDLSAHDGPRYRALAAAIEAAITDGDLAAGTRLPPQRAMAWQLGVTVGTVGRGYALAARRGLLSGEIGRGTFVRPAPDRPKAGEAMNWPRPGGGGAIDLTVNAPAAGPQGAALAETLRRIADQPDLGRLLRYMPSPGDWRHRVAGAAWVGRIGLEVPAAQIMLSAGAQQALAIALAAIAGNRETILVEEMTYCGLLDAAALLHLRPKAVAMDRHGLRPDDLDRQCRATGAKLLVVVPTFQNPTTAVMPEARRRDLVRVARRHDLIVVEDDVYGYLLDPRPPPIAALAPERTIYVTSASKSIGPGLRLGWIAGPANLMEALISALRSLCVTLPALTAELATLWIEDGTADRLVRWQRSETAARHAMAAEAFAGLQFRGDPACYHLLLDLPPPWRADWYMAAANERGIALVSAATFAVDGAPAPQAVRVCLGNPPTRQALAAALQTLRTLADETPRPRRYVI